MINIFYWSPCLEKVGTYKSTINSALSIGKYSKKKISVTVINVCGEWEKERQLFEKNNVDLVDIGFKFFNYLPKSGFLGSRLSYIFIAIISFFPLIKLLVKKKPDFFVSHLLTSVPLIIFNFLNLKTKLILRISGFPRMTIFRKILWKLCSKKISKVTFPSIELLNQLSKLKIFSREQSIFLPDPVINLKQYIIKKQSIKNNLAKPTNKKFFLSAGRLTKQKNFSYLIKEFKKFSNKNSKFDLLIFGKGEERQKLKDLIRKLNLSERVYLMGYTEYIYEYMRKSEAFILSSLWEDPGHVIIEAGFNNSFVISSNCKNGPSEFLQYGKAGILFENDKNDSLFEALEIFTSKKFEVKSKKFLLKKNSTKYSLLRHHNIFKDVFLN